jgi:hypothetical protein
MAEVDVMLPVDAKPDGIATADWRAISAVGSVVTVNGMLGVPVQGDAGTIGVGTTICGLWPGPPASVALGGIVESVYVGSAMVARPGIGTTTLLAPKSSIMVFTLAVGSQVPVMVAPPKGGASGSVAPGRTGGGRVPSKGFAEPALKRVFGVPVFPAVTHDVTAPMRPPEI